MSSPAALYKKLQLDKKKKALVKEKNGKIIVEPIKDFLELGGSLKTNKKPISSEEIHELFAEHVADEYKKEMNAELFTFDEDMQK